MFLEAVFLCEEPWLSRTHFADLPASASWEQGTGAQKQLSKNLFWIFFQAKSTESTFCKHGRDIYQRKHHSHSKLVAVEGPHLN